MKEKKISLSTKIFIALVLAIIVGIAFTSHAAIAVKYIKPFGTIFLNLIKWIVCPLVFFSIMSGVISMKDIRRIGSVGVKTVVYYLCTTAFAITIGLCFASLFKNFFPVLQTSDLSYTAASKVSFMDTLVGLFPSNFIKPFTDANLLQIIIASLIIGFALLMISNGKTDKDLLDFSAVETLNDIFLKVMEMIVSHRRFLSALSRRCGKWTGSIGFAG